MKLLIIEDEQSLRDALCKGFEKLGYAVDTAGDGEAALSYYYGGLYDAIVLDLNLPKMDGLEVLKAIRDENEEAKVLILSARSEVENKITGLDCGANDYLEKPFHFKELHARIRALLRRDYKIRDNEIKTRDLTLNLALKKVYSTTGEVALTKKEYGILEYLMMNKGRTVSGESLIEHVWDSKVNVFTNAFKVHLTSLRKKLPEGVIGTIRGEGYYVE